MSLVQIFVDAFKKAAGKKPDVDALEEARNRGVLGPTDHRFPTRTQPASGNEGIDRGDVAVSDASAGSSDPEEGGEIDRGDVSSGNLAATSGDPEEGGEYQPPAK